MTIYTLEKDSLPGENALQIQLTGQRNFCVRGKTTLGAINISPILQIATLRDGPIRVGIIDQPVIAPPGIAFQGL